MSSIFVVISYDSDEQLTFFDLIRAETAETASQIVADVREFDDVCVDAMTLKEFQEMTKRMEESLALHPVPFTRYGLAQAIGADEKEYCSECDEEIDDGEGWDGKCGNCADACQPINEEEATKCEN